MPYPVRRKPWRGGPNWNMVHGIRLYVNQAPAAPANPAVEAAINTALTSGVTRHIGTIPKGALLLPAQVNVITLFNGTTPAFVVGTEADDDALITAAGSAVTAAGYKANLVSGAAYGALVTADLEVFAKLTAPGVTAGVLDLLIPYYHNGD